MFDQFKHYFQHKYFPIQTFDATQSPLNSNCTRNTSIPQFKTLLQLKTSSIQIWIPKQHQRNSKVSFNSYQNTGNSITLLILLQTPIHGQA